MGSKSPRGCSSCRLVPMACHSWPALFGRTSNPRSGAAGMPSAGARDYAVAQPGPDHPAPRGAQEGGGQGAGAGAVTEFPAVPHLPTQRSFGAELVDSSRRKASTGLSFSPSIQKLSLADPLPKIQALRAMPTILWMLHETSLVASSCFGRGSRGPGPGAQKQNFSAPTRHQIFTLERHIPDKIWPP